MPSSRLLAVAGVLVTLVSLSPTPSAQTDLDSFMKDVVVRRDDNWKKLQQYILDEREETKISGPGGTRLWGEEREYNWFIRDGYFIRSPIRVDGAVVSDGERRKAEDAYLRAMKRFDERAAARGQAPDAGPVLGDENGEAPTSVDGLIRQSRQPRFVSSSYFMRFKFDEGRYALAGREKFEGRDVVKVEYYPTNLYGNDGRRGRRNREENLTPKQRQQQADIRRLMNKVALITMWIEPSSKQIVKYTFDNVDFDFLPGAWLLKVDFVKAGMTMSQPFPNAPSVWLPKDMEITAAFTLAIGQFSFRQAVAYRDYREATVGSKLIIPGAR